MKTKIKNLLTISIFFFAFLLWPVFIVQAAYELDQNFGTDGLVTYDGGLGWDIGYATTLDAEGNMYIAGGVSNASGNSDAALFKYDSAGNLAAGYPKTYDSGHGNDIGDSITMDAEGNMYIAGGVSNASGNLDAALFKYDSAGNLAAGYPKTYDGNGHGYDYARAITIDAEGNMYIVGAVESAPGNSDAALFKYDSAGNLAAGYPKTYDSGYGNDVGYAITTDAEGNMYIAGGVGNASGNSDTALFKYDSAGNLAAGYPKTYDGGSGNYDDSYAIVRDSAGNVYLAGEAYDASWYSSVSLIAYDASGNLLEGFPKTYGSGDDDYDGGYGLALDEAENIYLTGINANKLALFKYITNPATPSASVGSGNYSSSQSVSLSSTSDANIYYTTDGSTPTTSSTLYSSPISVSQSLTLKAKAFKSQLASELMTETYVISVSENDNSNSNDNEVISNENNNNSCHTPSVAVGNNRINLLSDNSISSVNKTNLTFKGIFASLPNGKVQIFRDGKLVGNGKTNKSGKWRIKIHPKPRQNIVSAYQFKYFDSNSQLVETTPSYQLMVDKLKPVINLPKTIRSSRGETITWQATDNNSVDYCTCSFRGKNYPVSDNSFTIPGKTPLGISNLRVTCYDQAKNKSSRKAGVHVE